MYQRKGRQIVQKSQKGEKKSETNSKKRSKRKRKRMKKCKAVRKGNEKQERNIGEWKPEREEEEKGVKGKAAE